MVPVIIQKTRSGFSVFKSMESVSDSFDPKDAWKHPRSYLLLKTFNRNCFDQALAFAREFPGFVYATLQETLGSWDRASFAPNPSVDRDLKAVLRVKREEVNQNGDSSREEGEKAGRKSRAQGSHKSRRASATVRTTRL